MRKRSMARKPGEKPRRMTKNNGAVKFGPLDHWVGFNLRMAQESAFSAFSHPSREIGESPGRFAILVPYEAGSFPSAASE